MQLWLWFCETPSAKLQTKAQVPVHANAPRISSAPKSLLPLNIVAVSQYCPGVRVLLKYATADNFMKQVLYTTWKDAYLQKEVADQLNVAQGNLKKTHPTYSLLVYDAARPVSIQQKMWKALDTIPVKQRVKFVSNPNNRSLHNYGCAVDLTIADENGIPLDMGAGYDDIRSIAYPSMESYYLKTGALSSFQVENRRLLRKVMFGAGFTNISTEWWHFNACSRKFAASHYQAILTEVNF
jgi:D-alanyl-D-alanine dipeptidase